MGDFSLTRIAMELLSINEDFPYRLKNPRQVHISDYEMYDFTQTWGSTSLGFGGIGGQAMTSARTYVLIPMGIDEDCLVYFAGKFAYAVPYSQKFMEDVLKQNVVAVYEKGKYKIK